MHPDASNGHFSHNHTIPPTDSTPQRSKRAAQHEVTAKGAAGIPIFHQFPANSLPAPRRPLSSSATPRTTAQSGHRTTLPDGQNAHPGAEQPTRDDTTPPSLTATIPVGHSAHDSTIRPPNNAPQRPKRATRHRMATKPHSPMAEICNPTQRGRGAARQTAGLCRNAVAGGRNLHIQSIVAVKPVRYRRRQHTEQEMRRRTWSACATSRNGQASR